jgi:hypothetical protein
MNNNDRKEKDDKAGKPKEGSVSIESHVLSFMNWLVYMFVYFGLRNGFWEDGVMHGVVRNGFIMCM